MREIAVGLIILLYYAYSTPKKLDKSPRKITKTAKPATEDDGESYEENYEVIEMRMTSSAKARYEPAQTTQKGTTTDPLESEAKKDSPANEENSQEDENGYMNVVEK